MSWIVISGVYFVAGTVMNVALVVAVIKMIKAVEDLQPKVNTTLETLQDVVKRVDQIGAKVNDTVSSVGGGAKSLAKTVDTVSKATNRQSGLISTAISAGLSLFRLYQEIEALRQSRQARKKKGESE